MIYSIKSSNKYQKASVFIPCPLVIMKLRGASPSTSLGMVRGNGEHSRTKARGLPERNTQAAQFFIRTPLGCGFLAANV
jgi:hypothetical protein